MCTAMLIKLNDKCFVYSGNALSYTKLVHRHSTQKIFTNNIQIEHNMLKIPTGRRQKSWLYRCTSMAEAGLEPGTSGFQVQCPYHWATLPP